MTPLQINNSIANPTKSIAKTGFDYLLFAKNMQNVGMEENIANELANGLKQSQILCVENLVNNGTFNDFKLETQKNFNQINITSVNYKNEIANINENINFLRTDLKEHRIEFKKELHDIRHEFKQELKDHKIEIRDEIKNLRTEMNDFKVEIKQEMNDFKVEMKQEMNDFKVEIKQDLADSKNEIDIKFIAIEKQLQRLDNFVTRQELKEEFEKFGMIMTIRMGIIMATGIGILGVVLKL